MISRTSMNELISASRVFLAPIIYKSLVDTVEIMYEFNDEECCKLVLETLPVLKRLDNRPIVAINAFLDGINRLEYVGKYTVALREVYNIIASTARG